MSEPRRSLGWLAVVAAFWVLQAVWLVSPIDPIPDFLPGVGQLDDLGAFLSAVGMTAYALWRAAPALRGEAVDPGRRLGGPVAPADGYEPLSAEELRSL